MITILVTDDAHVAEIQELKEQVENLETVKSIEAIKRIILVLMLLLFIICIIVYFCGKAQGVFKSDLVDGIKKNQITEPLMFNPEAFRVSNNTYPGMPFIAVRIGKHIITALINTGAQQSAISLEIATKCGMIKQIDRRNTDEVIGLSSPTSIYGKIYN